MQSIIRGLRGLHQIAQTSVPNVTCTGPLPPLPPAAPRGTHHGGQPGVSGCTAKQKSMVPANPLAPQNASAAVAKNPTYASSSNPNEASFLLRQQFLLVTSSLGGSKLVSCARALAQAMLHMWDLGRDPKVGFDLKHDQAIFLCEASRFWVPLPCSGICQPTLPNPGC